MARFACCRLGVAAGVAILAAACAGTPEGTTAEASIIIGADDRVEAAAASEGARSAASAVALVASASDLEAVGDQFRLRTSPLREALGLCADERFSSQPVAGRGTAFLVAPDVVATAGHVVDSQPLERAVFVFGFAIADGGGHERARLTFSADDIRTARRIIQKPLGVGGDWELVELDRPTTREPLRLRTGPPPQPGDGMIVLGHPSGLPIKASSGRVRHITPKLLMMDTDTFGGNSGSPVLNARTNEVEGLFMRGGLDYAPTTDGCLRAHVALEDFSEHAVRIDAIAPYVPH